MADTEDNHLKVCSELRDTQLKNNELLENVKSLNEKIELLEKELENKIMTEKDTPTKKLEKRNLDRRKCQDSEKGLQVAYQDTINSYIRESEILREQINSIRQGKAMLEEQHLRDKHEIRILSEEKGLLERKLKEKEKQLEESLFDKSIESDSILLESLREENLSLKTQLEHSDKRLQDLTSNNHMNIPLNGNIPQQQQNGNAHRISAPIESDISPSVTSTEADDELTYSKWRRFKSKAKKKKASKKPENSGLNSWTP